MFLATPSTTYTYSLWLTDHTNRLRIRQDLRLLDSLEPLDKPHRRKVGRMLNKGGVVHIHNILTGAAQDSIQIAQEHGRL